MVEPASAGMSVEPQKESAMLWNASAINGYSISGSDGHIGSISDFLFDDATWHVRWLVVETGGWLSGRKVLLPSTALAHLDQGHEECSVKLTMQQIKDSPDVDTERPVSRQMEASIYGYYGYSPYWDYGYLGGIGFLGGSAYAGELAGSVPDSPGSRSKTETVNAAQSHDDVHLRSVKAVTHYDIHASDGLIGHVEDFLVQDVDWSIGYLVVDTKNWWPGKKVLISPRSVKEIDWSSRLVSLDADRHTVKGAPAYDASITVGQADEDALLNYYGIEPANA
jgi:hypothetical protein